jgi:hypothetical protein
LSAEEIAKEHEEHPWTTEEQAAQIVREHHQTPAYKPFDDLEYTRRKLAGQLGLIQEHCSDGSAFANCHCIEEKHLINVSGYASEGVTIAPDPHEKNFYAWLSPWADSTLDHVLETLDQNDDDAEKKMWATLADDTREIRHEITNKTFNVPNPAGKRSYLPYGLTVREKEDAELRALLSRCIRKTEVRCCGGPTTDYSTCDCNPVAVCRKSVGTGNPKKLSSKEFLELYETIREHPETPHPKVEYHAPQEEVEPFTLEFHHKAAREKL